MKNKICLFVVCFGFVFACVTGATGSDRKRFSRSNTSSASSSQATKCKGLACRVKISSGKNSVSKNITCGEGLILLGEKCDRDFSVPSCNNGLKFDSASSECVLVCPQGQKYDPKVSDCVDSEDKTCENAEEIWNGYSCVGKSPFCTSGYQLNEAKTKCDKIPGGSGEGGEGGNPPAPSVDDCPEGQFRNSEGKCENECRGLACSVMTTCDPTTEICGIITSFGKDDCEPGSYESAPGICDPCEPFTYRSNHLKLVGVRNCIPCYTGEGATNCDPVNGNGCRSGFKPNKQLGTCERIPGTSDSDLKSDLEDKFKDSVTECSGIVKTLEEVGGFALTGAISSTVGSVVGIASVDKAVKNGGKDEGKGERIATNVISGAANVAGVIGNAGATTKVKGVVDRVKKCNEKITALSSAKSAFDASIKDKTDEEKDTLKTGVQYDKVEGITSSCKNFFAQDFEKAVALFRTGWITNAVGAAGNVAGAIGAGTKSKATEIIGSSVGTLGSGTGAVTGFIGNSSVNDILGHTDKCKCQKALGEVESCGK